MSFLRQWRTLLECESCEKGDTVSLTQFNTRHSLYQRRDRMSRFAVVTRAGGVWGQTMHFPTLQEAYNWADSDCFEGVQRLILNPEDEMGWIDGNKWSSYQHIVNQLDTTERVVGFYQYATERFYILFHDPEPEWEVPPVAEEYSRAMEVDEESDQYPAH